MSWLSSKVDYLDLFFEVMGVDFNIQISNFACKHDTKHILVTLGPNLYHGCISGVSWLSLKMDDLDLFFEVMGSIST